ncbi:MAG: hypothetical protein IJS01_05420 [Lentisphaeria bacterium]|nr:hypothetical protein [Lentisphaeria bacterium]
MLKLNASYSKKVPADGEYTSQSYHASIEVELPDGLSQEQLNGKIHETFAMVRDSVEAELHGKGPAGHGTPEPQGSRDPVPQGNRSAGADNAAPASPKQISYLLSLASRRGITPQQIAAQNNVSAIDQLTRRQCSALIEQWRAA